MEALLRGRRLLNNFSVIFFSEFNLFNNEKITDQRPQIGIIEYLRCSGVSICIIKNFVHIKYLNIFLYVMLLVFLR